MHSHIYLDFDVSPFKTQTERDAYVFNPSGPRTHIWPKRAHIGGDTECTLLSKVPSGNHILTISTGDEAGFHSDGKVHGSAITHIITY